MAASSAHVTDAELRVLKLLWELEPLAAREITEGLYAQSTSSEIGTVQTLLARLESKGLVRRDRSRHVHRFSPVITSAEFAGRQVAAMVDKLTDGSLAPVLAHLVQSRALSAEEMSELRRLLDEHPQPKRRGAR